MRTTLQKTKAEAGSYIFTAKARSGQPGTDGYRYNSAQATVKRDGSGWKIDGAGYGGLIVDRLRDAEAMLRIDLISDAKRGL